jgi:predicted outer membrane protein
VSKREGKRAARAAGKVMVTLAVALLATGCGNDDALSDREVEQLRSTGAERGEELGVLLLGEMQGQPGDEVIGNVAAVTRAVNDGEITQAELALQRTDSDNVRLLAERILVDHTAANERQRAVLTELGIAERPNTVRTRLEMEARSELDMLSAVSDDRFDEEYLRTQILLHAQAEALLRTTEPMVLEASFRQYLVELRATVVGHLEEASRIARSPLR